ncbi:YadA-like family protein [uncultured Phascolarctobacterium sp.]|uniref:YadA-like family protein n=1 Tax=uncultured Phascolarctobacterium sp. TaxID=512296 RepID=UPI0025F7DA32|nr:YadA-like family protein [uncultured Phascolarctobacterium sp.]
MKKTVLMNAAKKARIALAVMALCGMSFAGAQSAFAENVTVDANKNIICGDGAKAEKATGSTVDPANDIVIGVNAIANDKNSIAIGTNANAKAENSVAIGYGSVADAANTISFGSAIDTSKNKKLVNLAAGTSNNDAATYGQVITSVKQNGNKLEFYTGTNTTNAAMDVELYHPVKFEGSNLIGGSGAKVGEGRRIDTFSITSPNNNVVLGNKAQANGEYNVVMGVGAIANNYRSIVIGESAKGDVMSVAMGAFAEDSGGGVAIGFNAKNKGTAAIGSSSKADGSMAIAIGGDAKATGAYTIAMSYKSEASKENAMAFGEYAKASGTDTIAMGYFSEASKEKSIAIGYYAKATGTDSIAIRGTASGYKSKAFGGTASGDYSIAIGGTAAEAYSYAIGGQAKGKYSVSIGEGSVATDRSTVSVGSGVDDGYGGFSSAPGYRRIVNVQDGYNNHDAATYGQIIKKDNYTISLDSAGSGQAVLKTNADKEGPTITVDASALETQITKNADAIGTLTNLTTTEKGNLVGAVNEVKGSVDAAQTKANDAFTQANTNKASIGTLTNLTTTEKGNLVGAVNEVKGTADAAQTKANDAFTQANTNKASIGTLTNLTTTEKGNLVGALNEVKGSVDAANTAIAGKADLGLSNINAAGETVIKNLAKTEAGAIVNVQLGDLSTEKYYVDAGKKVNENISALDKQVKVNADAITAVDSKIGDLSADGHYILKSNKVAQNLNALDTNLYNVDNRVGTFTPGSTYNYISAGNNVIDNLIALDKKVAENKATIAGSAFDGSKLNDAIKNVDVAGGYKETATNPNADTKGTVAGAINSAYQAGKEYTDTKVTAVEGKLNTLETKVDKNTSDISNIKTNIGDMSKLDVNDKNNLVDAVNEAYKAATSAGANVGKLDELTTTNKDNLVGAVNEVNKKANDAQTTADNALNKANDAQTTANSALNKANANENKIGALNSLTTTEKGNLVGAVNEVNNKANANEKNIGDLTKLNTTEKGNLVGAVNEVNKKADKNADDIKTVNGRVDELGGRVDTLGGAVAKLDSRVNKVGAGAAALAALHPMEFDSDNKLSFAAGVGNYRGTNAAAIGAFYRPSEQVMFSISGNMGNGENMVNAGVSFALDRPSKTPTTKAALVKTVVAQNEQIAALNETVAEQSNALEAQSKEIAELKAMVQKLAAKQNA